MENSGEFGKVIRTQRRKLGLTQQQVVDRANSHFLNRNPDAKLPVLSQPALAQIENGTSSPAELKTRTLWALAKTLELPVDNLMELAVSNSVSEANLQEAKSPEIKIEVGKNEGENKVSFGGEDIVARLIKMSEDDTLPERLPNWDSTHELRAADYILKFYYPAFNELKTDRQRLKFITHLITRAYTNIGLYDLSDQLLNSASTFITRSEYLQNDPLLASGISEGKGWNQAFREPSGAAKYFKMTHPLFIQFGDYGHESTIFHFLARIMIETQIPVMFPELNLAPLSYVFAETINAHLTESKRLKTQDGDPSGGVFNLLWEARLQSLMNDMGMAQQTLSKILPMFQEMNLILGEGQALIETARYSLLRETDTYSLSATRDQIEGVIGSIFSLQHPQTTAEAFCMLAYCYFIMLFVNLSNEKNLAQVGADACEIVTEIYPESAHPLHIVADTMKKQFISHLSKSERNQYLSNLEPRIREREGVFRWLLTADYTQEDKILHQMAVNTLISKLQA